MSFKSVGKQATPTAILEDGSEPHAQDDALTFIRAHRDEVDATLYADSAYAKRLRRKVDLLVMPFLLLCYSMNFLDKVLLNYANVMGLTPALNLVGNDFSNASSAFFIAVLIAAVPNMYLLQRLPVAKWLGFCLTVWGVCTAFHAVLHDYAGLLTVRVFCGIFEAGIPSALMLISSQWYTRAEQASRFAYWYCGLGVGQILGGLISWAFQFVLKDPADLTSGWRMMFVALGVFTFLLGIMIMLFVPDAPWRAWFFSTEEKVNLLEHVRVNQSGIIAKGYQPTQLLEGILDVQVWLMFLIILLQGVGGGTITTYSATLLRSFGFTPQQAALLNMPSGVINITSTLFCGLMSRYLGLRWFWTATVSVVGIAGAALMSWLSTTNRSGLLAGIYLANFIVGAAPTDYQWVLTNTAGHTKRAYVAAMMNAAFATGNIIGPQTYRAVDAPQYEPAKVTLVACWSASVGLTIVLAIYYLIINRRRDRDVGCTVPEQDVSEAKAFAGLTDRKNKDFRYVY
ncbi:hypothetical protein AMS68_005026 [Peltaster fructicola]|uniref:Major facilitator superfamily (MFS) profile domain-containing protein n=1 Tax=Peltaster fructicola TaxID=286661 RepID=A0A6H0XY12_9PEZI|nr:hypothetical protein AMS68_005026 [Peltaster fructicola]